MPRRTPVDRAVVMETFEILGSVKKTSQFLGLHYNTVYSVISSASGLCVNCHKPAKPGHRRCSECSLKAADRMKAKRRERARSGFCSMCEEPRSVLSPMYCDRHRIMAAERNTAYKERGRGVPVPVVVSKQRRIKDLRRRHGEAAVQTMEEANWCCEICGDSDDVVSVQLHHIDEDPANANRGNMAALCFYCHRSVHMFRKLRDKDRFSQWMEKTYPDVIRPA